MKASVDCRLYEAVLCQDRCCLQSYGSTDRARDNGKERGYSSVQDYSIASNHSIELCQPMTAEAICLA